MKRTTNACPPTYTFELYSFTKLHFIASLLVIIQFKMHAFNKVIVNIILNLLI